MLVRQDCLGGEFVGHCHSFMHEYRTMQIFEY